MRINTDGKYAWRTDLYDRVGEQLGENTRSGAIDDACEFTEQMLPHSNRRESMNISADPYQFRRVSYGIPRETAGSPVTTL